MTNYSVTKLALLVEDSHRNELNHMGTDSSPPPA
jgi:hypothetical protein